MSEMKQFTHLVSRSHGYRLFRQKAANGDTWFYGIVVTPLGYVHVHAEPSFTSLSTMFDSHEVNRFMRHKKGLTQRGLVTLARRFIEEVSQ